MKNWNFDQNYSIYENWLNRPFDWNFKQQNKEQNSSEFFIKSYKYSNVKFIIDMMSGSETALKLIIEIEEPFLDETYKGSKNDFSYYF